MRYMSLTLIALTLLLSSCLSPVSTPHPSDEVILQRATGICMYLDVTGRGRATIDKCMVSATRILCEDQRPLSETCLEALTSGRLGK